eukprot:gene7367-8149_t
MTHPSVLLCCNTHREVGVDGLVAKAVSLGFPRDHVFNVAIFSDLLRVLSQEEIHHEGLLFVTTEEMLEESAGLAKALSKQSFALVAPPLLHAVYLAQRDEHLLHEAFSSLLSDHTLSIYAVKQVVESRGVGLVEISWPSSSSSISPKTSTSTKTPSLTTQASSLTKIPLTFSGSCHARVGLMGNPTDNFEGKTISFLLGNFRAEVQITEEGAGGGGGGASAIDLCDPCIFPSWSQLSSHSNTVGYSNGLCLLQASCKVFYDLVCRAGLQEALKHRPGFRLTYQTTIPRMVGLSGSSAIVVATFRALMAYYSIRLADLNIELYELPEYILKVERDELGISAGLQDRVVQVYGGMVAMNFDPSVPLDQRYERLDLSLLPPMYLLYNVHAGGESGKVHSTVKQRWAQRETDLVKQVREMIANTEVALHSLREHDYQQLSKCMETNFSFRRAIYGDAVVGESNVRLADLAAQHGLAAKFTGSGGAFICVRKDGMGWFSEAEEERMRPAFTEKGFALLRVTLPEEEEQPGW